jgi:hypothetical protein
MENPLYNFYLTLLLIQSIKSLQISQNNILVQYRHYQFPLFKLLQTSILSTMALYNTFKRLSSGPHSEVLNYKWYYNGP